MKAYTDIEQSKKLSKILYNIRTYEEDNPVDACYEMIIKLHELDAL